MFIELIRCDQIKVSEHQPRKYFLEEEIQELAHSIEQVGLLQPLVVKPREEGFELVAGERRLKALQQLKIEQVPVVVQTFQQEASALASLIENIQRVDLDPLELGRSYQKIIKDFSLTQETLAKKLGKKRSTVAHYMRLLSLPSEIQQGLQENKITLGHAKILGGIQGKKNQLEMYKKVIQEHFSVRKLENYLKGRKKENRKVRSVHIEVLEAKLLERLGTRVRLIEKKRGGVMMIDWEDLDVLDHLLEVLGVSDE